LGVVFSAGAAVSKSPSCRWISASDFNNQVMLVTKRREGLPKRKYVLWAIVALRRFRYGVLAARYTRMAEPRQRHRISFTSEYRVQYPQAA